MKNIILLYNFINDPFCHIVIRFSTKNISYKARGCLLSILPYREDSNPQTREFLARVVDVLLDFIQQILEFKMPEEMQKMLDLNLPEDPLPLKQLLEDCKTTLKHQVKTGHPHFFNQLSCGLDIISLAGEWLTAAANTNMFTYEIAPVFILMENVVWICLQPVCVPGGPSPQVPACHYSVKSCASVGGLGTDYCIAVPSDERGRMITSELERLVRYHRDRGNVPFFVNATSGTTVLGAFDPLMEIADICQKYDMWMHVDAAWGGGLLFSKKADSVTWNPHKLMGTLLQCSTVHFKYEGILLSCNAMSAEYLFMTDKIYDPRFDTGDKVIQCGRHNDIFKLWLQWRGKGTSGFERLMDRLMELSEYMVRRIKEQSDKFHLILEPEMVNVSFWYLPKQLRGLPHDSNKEIKLGKVCAKLKGRMMQAGTIMVGYQPDDRRPNFFRNIISSAAVTEKDVDFLLSEMDRLGHDIVVD
ncbi:unnamed protein product [Leptidea sinapis]|uniref:Glutamate decarboxylase n=1 Tax=Leptidea sinapis TaxID=189913 RepID=A0A5E4R4E3_9NEOP|nr:unnamed protein product [Leptidea sinapis]